MEMVLRNGFCEMDQNEMLEVDGGAVPVVILGPTVLALYILKNLLD